MNTRQSSTHTHTLHTHLLVASTWLDDHQGRPSAPLILWVNYRNMDRLQIHYHYHYHGQLTNTGDIVDCELIRYVALVDTKLSQTPSIFARRN